MRGQRHRHAAAATLPVGKTSGFERKRARILLGARERSDALVKIAMENDDPFVPLVVERQVGETQLFVKQVKVEDNQLKKDDKALVGNSAYPR